MKSNIAKSLNVAIQVALVGFEKSYTSGETLDTILGYTDFLTGLPNRKAFERDRKKVDPGKSLVMIDIDDFKSINDIHGHLYGDRVLRRLAKILKNAVGTDGRAYRIAGDEFVLLVPKFKVKVTCDRIRNTMRKENNFTISQGIVLNLARGITETTLHQADIALYQSKARGKDRITMSIPAVA